MRGVEIGNTGPIGDGPAIEGEVAKATLPHCWRARGRQNMPLDQGIFTQRPPVLQGSFLWYCKP